MFIFNKLFTFYFLNILLFFIGLYEDNFIIVFITFLFIMTFSKKIKEIILNSYEQNDDKDTNNHKIEIISI
jgi:hypothetical protein